VNLDAYLARIGLDHRPPATLAGLTALHHAHLTSISYENLDVQLGRPVTIERPAIYDKIIGRRRGGVDSLARSHRCVSIEACPELAAGGAGRAASAGGSIVPL